MLISGKSNLFASELMSHVLDNIICIFLQNVTFRTAIRYVLHGRW